MHLITKHYKNAFEKFGLQPELLEKEINGFSVELGQHRYFFRDGYTPFNTVSGTSVARNKFSTNQLLALAGLPVPVATAVSLEEYRDHRFNFDKLQYPVVVKPTWDSACGYCVVCNIQNKAALIKHFDRYIHSQKCISIETFHPGLRSFRVLVFYGQVIGVVERFPAKVVGDGQHSIRELIKEQNMIRKKLKKTIPTGPITINEESGMILSQLGLTLESIPDKEQIIPLRYICNSTYGGTFKSLPTTIICKENAALAIEAARVLDLNLVGFDIICDDIAIPIKSSHGYIIEANADPDITIHEGSFGGKDVMVSETIVKKLIKSHPLDYLRHYFRIHGFIGITLRLGFFMLIFFGLLYGSQFYAG